MATLSRLLFHSCSLLAFFTFVSFCMPRQPDKQTSKRNHNFDKMNSWNGYKDSAFDKIKTNSLRSLADYLNLASSWNLVSKPALLRSVFHICVWSLRQKWMNWGYLRPAMLTNYVIVWNVIDSIKENIK